MDKTPTFKNDLVISYPNITEINFAKIGKKYLYVLFIKFFIMAVFLFSILFGITQLGLKKNNVFQYTSVFYIGLFILLIVNLLLVFLEFKKREYAVRDKDITYKKGLLNHKLITVPFNRIQHLNVTEGMFSRLFKLASLHIYTAGDDSSDLVIKGLSKSKAYEIREFILQETKDL